MPYARRRTKPAGSCSCGTTEPSVTSPVATPLRRLFASSSSSTTRRSGSRRMMATSSPSSTRTSLRPRGPRARTSRTSGSGRGSPISCTRSSTTIWPPSGSKAARFPRSRSARNFEEAEDLRLVNRAVVLPAPCLQRHRHRLLPLERSSGQPLLDLRAALLPLDREVVDRRLVCDHEGVLARFERLHLRCTLLEGDRVARPNGAGQFWGRCLSGHEERGCGQPRREKYKCDSFHAAPPTFENLTLPIRAKRPGRFARAR